MSDRLIDSPDVAPDDHGPVRFRGGPLSNFHVCELRLRHPFIAPGDHRPALVTYKTAEHRFQAMKATTHKDHEFIRAAASAKGAKARGQQIKLSPLWEYAKFDVMREVLNTKMLQCPEFREALLATGGRGIVEDAPWDEVWGSGKNGHGRNMLGKLLVEVRHGYSFGGVE